MSGSAATTPEAMIVPDMRIDQALIALRRRLENAEISTAALDARLLLTLATGKRHEDLVRGPEHLLSQQQAALLETYLLRRLDGEPVARISGTKEFWGRTFHLSPQTLVPRPDSEIIVERALQLIKAGDIPQGATMADLGTGSGCLLISILADCPGLRGVGTDMSRVALATARSNAQIHGVSARSMFVQCDFAAALRPGLALIVANPPYIASEEIAGLARDVRNYDPVLALDGGADGLQAIASLAPQVARVLGPGGHFLLEIGQNQHHAAARILSDAGLEINPMDGFCCDYAGIVRVLHGRKPGN